jgi:large subunit ribosomal protein L29
MSGNTTKAEDLRGRTGEELVEFVRDKENELLRLKFQRATGQLENIRRVSQVKREIARAKTIAKEKAAAK